MNNKIDTTLKIIDELIDAVEDVPSYGLMSAFSTPMINYVLPNQTKTIGDMFKELEDMLKEIEKDTKLSDVCIRCKNHNLYYDFTYQKLHKVKKELKEIKSYLSSIQ